MTENPPEIIRESKKWAKKGLCEIGHFLKNCSSNYHSDESLRENLTKARKLLMMAVNRIDEAID